MAFCHERGIPHSEFLRKWSDEDRAKLFAYVAHKAEFCQMCGTAPWQWEENPYAFEPLLEVCHGCEKKDVAREDGVKLPPGASMVLVPQEEARRRRYAQLEAARRAREG